MRWTIPQPRAGPAAVPAAGTRLERTMHCIDRMTLAIDDAKFQQILDVTLGGQPITPPELCTLLQVIQLAAEVDLDEDPAELTLLRSLTERLCTATGIALDRFPLLSPIPTDDEERAAQLAALVQRLPTTGTRDLAFALAYLMIVSDLELAPVEDALLDQLRRALTIPPERASRLLDTVGRIVTPGADEARPIAATVC
jgi:hypothetical protein